MLQDNPSQMLRPSLSLKWKKGKDMPIVISSKVQSVVFKNFVYVGGGDTDNDRDRCTVMRLNLQRDEWTKLPRYNAMWFAMTSLDNQLVLVGGREPVTREVTNRVAVFVSGRWTNPYPPMNTARHSSTAVSFKNHIIVAGGLSDQGNITSSVEVLDVEAGRWYSAESLPNARSQLRSTLIGDTLYLIGGRCFITSTKVVHKVDVREWISLDYVSVVGVQTGCDNMWLMITT